MNEQGHNPWMGAFAALGRKIFNKSKDFENEYEKRKNRPKMDAHDKVLMYKRKNSDWEVFECICGSTKQLSPEMKNTEFCCSNCGRKIKIVSGDSTDTESNSLSSNAFDSIDGEIFYAGDIKDNIDEEITYYKDIPEKKVESPGCLFVIQSFISSIGILLSFAIKTPEGTGSIGLGIALLVKFGAGSIGLGIALLVMFFNLIFFFVSKNKLVKIISLAVWAFYLIMLYLAILGVWLVY